MPTNEERRKVAARLRKTEPSSIGTIFDAIRNIGLCVNPGGGSFRTLALELADLIEPEERTCEAEQDWDAMEDGVPDCRIWRCSCGEAFPYWRGVEPSFCTECGAKVVKND